MKRAIFPLLVMAAAVLISSCATKDRAQTARGSDDYATTGASQTDNAWPMKFEDGTTAYTIFEPQCDSWNGHQLAARSAVAVQPAGQAEPTYGVVAFNAITLVDKSTRTATLANFRVTSADFPSARNQTQNYLAPIVQNFSKHTPALALDGLESSLTAAQPPKSDRLNNAPPKIIIATRPAVLVYIDGPPAWRSVPGTELQRVINTRMLLLKDSANKYYLHLFDGYLQAPSLQGPWSVASQPPNGAATAETAALDSGQVDLMHGTPDATTQKVPSLSSSPVPEVYIASKPSELIEFHGAADYVSVPGTDLLYVQNTSGNVFKSLTDQENYILISGRWYRAASLAGPWQFVPGNQLPHDFANIPDSSPKENVKASVPGTSQAEEAIIANSIPQSAAVARTNQMAAPQFDGAMQLAPIQGTPLHYVVNSPTPIIEEDPQSWYACQDGVWYAASSATGPWRVATFVPPVIYTIPPDSPLHYLTYVQVYGSSPAAVYEGYTPGYMGTEVAADGTVVYGTGYDYDPWVGAYWYGPPVTWGWGFDNCWAPWWGWGFGCGFGWGWGFGWASCYPPFPWWGGFHHFHDFDGDHWRHDGNWRNDHSLANTSANIYRPQSRFADGGRSAFARQNELKGTGQAYNSRTGWLQAGQHARVQNVPGAAWNTSRRATVAPNNTSGFSGANNNRGTWFGGTRTWSAPSQQHNFYGTALSGYAGRNYSYAAPRFGDLNRGFQSYPKGSWSGGNNWGAMPMDRGFYQSHGNMFQGGSTRGGEGGGGSFHGGGGGFHGGGGGGGGRR